MIAMTVPTPIKPAAERPTFTITLRAEPNVEDAIRALRAALKSLLRRHGLRAIAVREDHREKENA
jgi:hypothetical protein